MDQQQQQQQQPPYRFPKDDEYLTDLPKATQNISLAENTIAIIGLSGSPLEEEMARKLIIPLKGVKKRDWFSQKHIYHCPPVILGNQVGFLVTLEVPITVIWNGLDGKDDVKVKLIGSQPTCQTVSSHFGMGTVTVQNSFQIRTPKDVNLMLIHPTNYATHGYICMGAYLETDNLRRDFTFNLKFTKPGEYFLDSGSVVGCLIPIPRYFVDDFKLAFNQEALSSQELAQEREAEFLLGRERRERDAKYFGGVGRRYLNGFDAFGQEFTNHQKTTLSGKKS